MKYVEGYIVFVFHPFVRPSVIPSLHLSGVDI